jgi:Cu2+-exporting ATPase
VNPFHWIKADDAVIAGTINGNKSFVMIAEKLVQKPCFRKLCKWLIQPVAPEHRYKIGRQNSEVFCTNSSGSFNNHFFVWAKFGPEPAIVYGFINAIAV